MAAIRCWFGHDWVDPYRWNWGGIWVWRRDCRRCKKAVVTGKEKR